MANRYDDLGRREALAAFARFEREQQTAFPQLRYCDILTRVHQDVANELHLQSNSDLDAAFGHSVALWPSFPDTAEALRILKQHFKLVILSNVHHDGFAASNQKLGVEFDALYLAEDIGSYKPDPANFEYLLEHIDQDFGVDPDDLLHTAESLVHDHVQANGFELANCWIDRQRQSESGQLAETAALDEMPPVDYKFYTLQEMADAVLAEELL